MTKWVALTNEDIDDILAALVRYECSARLCFYSLKKKLESATEISENFGCAPVSEPYIKLNGVLIE